MTPRSTIVGVATGTPDGGVAIVRLSGPDVRGLVARLGIELGDPRRLARRSLRVGPTVEDALVAFMPGPASYTGEDVVELHVHGGARNVEQIVASVVAAGAVPAQRGDFTRRAFEAGRITLDRAEGIAALVGAQTQAAVDQARRLIRGEVGRAVAGLVERVTDLRAEIEARLDFPDDLDDADMDRMREAIASVAVELRGWVARYAAGARARTRRRIVLVGPPNAGKSSLFNALVGAPRSIVTDAPGTTRDYIEAEIDLDGVACVVVDTAGLRHVAETVERAGVERSLEQVEQGDVVLWLEGADADPAPRPDLVVAAAGLVEVETKRDLGRRRPGWSGVSVDDPDAIAALRRTLSASVRTDAAEAWIGTLRHRELAEAAIEQLDLARAMLGRPELAAFHLAAAATRLAEVEGRGSLGPVADDVMDRVFERFCLGK